MRIWDMNRFKNNFTHVYIFLKVLEHASEKIRSKLKRKNLVSKNLGYKRRLRKQTCFSPGEYFFQLEKNTEDFP